MHRWGPLALASLVAVLLTWRMAPPPPCVPLAITSSEEKASLLMQLSDDFEASRRKAGDQCIDVTVTRKPSGAAEQALARGWNDATDGPRPDAWLPAAITWIYLLGHHHPNLARSDSPSLLNSPLVIGVPREMAVKLGWPDKDIGWSTLLQLASNQTGWGTYGHSDWGPFRLGKTNPNFSTSGLHALIATYFAASGKTRDLSIPTLGDPAVRAFVMGVEKPVVHYGDTVSNFLVNLQAADDERRALSYVSALAMEEKQIWDYNQGIEIVDSNGKTVRHPKPNVPLVAIYPKEGTLAADHPYAVLNAPWMTAAKRQAAEAFLRYLQTPKVQAGFQKAGFRDQRGIAGPVINPENGMLPNRPGADLKLPTGQVLSDIQASWNQLRKRARVLIVIDRSALSGAADAKKLAQSVSDGLTLLADDDVVGAWGLPAAAADAQPYVELADLHSLGSHRADLQSVIAATQRSSDRPALYQAVAQAVAKLKTSQDPSKINAVLVISAGRGNPADANRFKVLADLSAEASEIPGIHVFTVAYGKSPDKNALQEIAKAGKGAYYDASDPSSVARALIAVISNF